jgi:hypothetical protein
MSAFVKAVNNPDEDIFATAIYLENYRNSLLKNTIDESHLDEILDEYLTTLVYWLRGIAFIAKYRLVSIKDIQFKYRLGSQKEFIHYYSELHGVYNSMDSSSEEDYKDYAIGDEFTYNQSVLLFSEKNVETALDNIANLNTFLSLSPLIIDQSVFSEKDSQTPEIYYFTGKTNRQYHFDDIKMSCRLVKKNKKYPIKA